MKFTFVIVILISLFFMSAAADAQTVRRGTFEIAGVTNISANRQTISTTDENGQPQPGNVNFTSINVGCELSYYIVPKLGVGVLVSHQGVMVRPSEGDPIVDVSGGY